MGSTATTRRLGRNLRTSYELLAFDVNGDAARQCELRVVVRVGSASQRMARGYSYNQMRTSPELGALFSRRLLLVTGTDEA